ncbi:hypothetical protein EV201_1274 [Ancylomarina subtilis]|uniref:Uncharacterized protein n=1 Tax=Ancylomarina subtilis TaxID=1639035 RepID=A0A4Q7VK97_9BACT|nr:hypothetical protein EV201_1274 [Ancylomarina subtilis]
MKRHLVDFLRLFYPELGENDNFEIIVVTSFIIILIVGCVWIQL